MRVITGAGWKNPPGQSGKFFGKMCNIEGVRTQANIRSYDDVD